MFWSGNYIVVRELNFLLKEENVSLTQVLEADDILQECKADNKALIQFLTKPEILAELITLITEEPPGNVELTSQYRHASIACEVLTSHLSMLSDRLSLDAAQMNRLCDFIARDPPLNPLLASYFSKTVEMLLERSPKQDWYLYHIVCLRVLDFFKARRDFLPNLLRHLATSAIADTFKYFIRLDDLFNKIIMEWLEEHQFLESLIQIICGTYEAPLETRGLQSDRGEDNHKGDGHDSIPNNKESDPSPSHGGAPPASPSPPPPPPPAPPSPPGALPDRLLAVASANAAALLCDLVLNGCAGEGATTRGRTSTLLVARLSSGPLVRQLLQSVFTCGRATRAAAVVRGAQLLAALLAADPLLPCEWSPASCGVELLVAPHLPLLHQALLQLPHGDTTLPAESIQPPKRVGAARVQVAALVAQLALSEVEDVANAMLTLGTPGVLVEMMLSYPDNNLLHAAVSALVRNALNNRAHRHRYAQHLIEECDILTRLMDVFEENENKTDGTPRAAYMGHVTMILRRVARALEAEPALCALGGGRADRWARFGGRLAAVGARHDTPLGGYYPSENVYDGENLDECIALDACYEFNDMGADVDELGDDNNIDDVNELCGAAGSYSKKADINDEVYDETQMASAKNSFLDLVNQRRAFDDDTMWEDSPEGDAALESRGVRQDGLLALGDIAPWDSSEADSSGGEGWAQFGSDGFPAPVDPFAASAGADDEFSPFWSSAVRADNDTQSTQNLEQSMAYLSLNEDATKKMHDSTSELANNLLTAMSAMAPDEVANIVNANMPDDIQTELNTQTGTVADSPVNKVSYTPIDALPDTKAESTMVFTDSPIAITQIITNAELGVSEPAKETSSNNSIAPSLADAQVKNSTDAPVEMIIGTPIAPVKMITGTMITPVETVTDAPIAPVETITSTPVKTITSTPIAPVETITGTSVALVETLTDEANETSEDASS